MCHLRRDLSGCGHPSVEGVNPVRNSSGALNPGGIILKSNPAAEQQGIISNGVKIDGEIGDKVFRQCKWQKEKHDFKKKA